MILAYDPDHDEYLVDAFNIAGRLIGHNRAERTGIMSERVSRGAGGRGQAVSMYRITYGGGNAVQDSALVIGLVADSEKPGRLIENTLIEKFG